MYRYYEKDGYEIMYYRFDSVTEYIDYLTTTTINKRKFPNPKSISGNYSFCKTKSFEEALELMKYGYHEDFEKLMELKITLEKYIKLTNKRSNQVEHSAAHTVHVLLFFPAGTILLIDGISFCAAGQNHQVDSTCDRPAWIQLVQQLYHLFSQRHTLFSSWFADLIANGIQDDRGMIVIPAHQLCQVILPVG